jgi:hypothetical protein
MVRAAVGMLPDEPDRFLRDGEEVGPREVHGPHPREVQELAQQAAQPVALPDDEPAERPFVLIGTGS